MTPMRTLFVFTSVTLIGLLACREAARSQPPRNASRPGFDDLQITISAHQSVDSPVSLLVQLANPASFGQMPCFVAPAEMRVTIDGHPLQLADPGGPSGSSRLSGIEIKDVIGCRPAMFRTPPATQLAAPTTSVIVVEHGTKRGEVTVSNLLPKRTVRALPSATVRPGDRVTLEWTHDDWIGSDLSTSVSIYYPDDFSVSIPREQLDLAPSRFTFRVPQIRPGRALVTFYPGSMHLASRQLRCRGFRSCDVRPNDHHDQLELTIAP